MTSVARVMSGKRGVGEDPRSKKGYVDITWPILVLLRTDSASIHVLFSNNLGPHGL